MQHRRGTLMPVGIVSVFLCLLVLCAPLAASEPDANTESATTAGSDDAGEQESDPKHEDILDRMFAPLDDAVTDINRDINEGDNNGEPEASE
jgi:hypothetical protein